MKLEKKLIALGISAIFFLFTGHLNQVFAASCTNVRINPRSGDFNTPFILTAQCDTDGSYNIVTFNPSDRSVLSMSGLVQVTGGSLRFSAIPSSTDPIGTYTMEITYQAQEESIGQETFRLTAPPPNTPTEKTCCTITSNEAGFCSQLTTLPQSCIVTNQGDCPQRCQAVNAGSFCGGGTPGGEFFYCAASGGLTHQSTCISSGGFAGIDTAIGCIPFESTNDLAAFFFRWAAGIGGGIAILLIIYASFIMITSGGDPKKLQSGKELLTAAISGIILIIFSVFILRLLGVNILGIF